MRLSPFLTACLAGQFPTVAGCGPPQVPHLAGMCLQAVPGLAGQSTTRQTCPHGPRAYKIACWAVPTGLEAAVA